MRISAAPRKDFIGNIGRNRSTAAAIAAAAREIDLAPLEDAFERKAPDDEVVAALRTVADAMRAKVFQIHRAATGEDPGGDQIEPIQALLAKALLAEGPALGRRILGFIGREEPLERFGEDVENTRALCAFRALETDDAVRFRSQQRPTTLALGDEVVPCGPGS